jgi:hypothetical protein
MKKIILILSGFIMLYLTGCTSKSPGCADESTQSLVIDISKQQLSEFLSSESGKLKIDIGFSQIVQMAGGKIKNTERYDEITLYLDKMVATKYDEGIDKHFCKASLVSSLGDNKNETEITYTSQLGNKGDQQYVELDAFDDEDYGSIIGVVLVENNDN